MDLQSFSKQKLVLNPRIGTGFRIVIGIQKFVSLLCVTCERLGYETLTDQKNRMATR